MPNEPPLPVSALEFSIDNNSYHFEDAILPPSYEEQQALPSLSSRSACTSSRTHVPITGTPSPRTTSRPKSFQEYTLTGLNDGKEKSRGFSREEITGVVKFHSEKIEYIEAVTIEDIFTVHREAPGPRRDPEGWECVGDMAVKGILFNKRIAEVNCIALDFFAACGSISVLVHRTVIDQIDTKPKELILRLPAKERAGQQKRISPRLKRADSLEDYLSRRNYSQPPLLFVFFLPPFPASIDLYPALLDAVLSRASALHPVIHSFTHAPTNQDACLELGPLAPSAASQAHYPSYPTLSTASTSDLPRISNSSTAPSRPPCANISYNNVRRDWQPSLSMTSDEAASSHYPSGVATSNSNAIDAMMTMYAPDGNICDSKYSIDLKTVLPYSVSFGMVKYVAKQVAILFPLLGLPTPPSTPTKPSVMDIQPVEYIPWTQSDLADCFLWHGRSYPSIEHFVRTVVQSSGLTIIPLFMALIYVRKVRHDWHHSGSAPSQHCIFLACLSLASKFWHDERYRTVNWFHWSDEVFNIQDLFAMEKHLLQILDYQAGISENELKKEFASYLKSIDIYSTIKASLSSINSSNMVPSPSASHNPFCADQNASMPTYGRAYTEPLIQSRDYERQSLVTPIGMRDTRRVSDGLPSREKDGKFTTAPHTPIHRSYMLHDHRSSFNPFDASSPPSPLADRNLFRRSGDYSPTIESRLFCNLKHLSSDVSRNNRGQTGRSGRRRFLLEELTPFEKPLPALPPAPKPAMLDLPRVFSADDLVVVSLSPTPAISRSYFQDQSSKKGQSAFRKLFS
ncbi:hypothetical protein M422DRAFT_774982 [Sphaerobolus stellatus SS14]|nr:hypothetical protein M422DRAFT_774982 [Sphaerobolus stellatus SS14]